MGLFPHDGIHDGVDLDLRLASANGLHEVDDIHHTVTIDIARDVFSCFDHEHLLECQNRGTRSSELNSKGHTGTECCALFISS